MVTTRFPWSQPARHTHRGDDIGAAARAGQHALACRQFSHHGEGVRVGDHQHFVAHRAIKISRE